MPERDARTDEKTGPIEVFGQNTGDLDALIARWDMTKDTLATIRAVNKRISTFVNRQVYLAEEEARQAGYDADKEAARLLDEIHQAAELEANPLEYVRAMLNVRGGGMRIHGKRLGEAAYHQLTQLHEALSQTGTPVVMVGTDSIDYWQGDRWDASLITGRSAGNIRVRKAEEREESHLAAASGVVLEIALNERTGYSQGDLRVRGSMYQGRGWKADSEETGFSPISHDLWRPEVVYTAEQVRALADSEPDETLRMSGSERDNHRYYNQKVVGLPPLVAVGFMAAREVLRVNMAHLQSLSDYERDDTNINEVDILAAAVRISIDPTDITTMSQDEIKVKLRAAFEDEACSIAGSLIYDAVEENTILRPEKIKVITTAEVADYIELTHEQIAIAVQRGFKHHVSRLKTVRLDDLGSDYSDYSRRQTGINQSTAGSDRRITQFQAAGLVSDYLRTQCDISISPVELVRSDLEQTMRQRLVEVIERYKTLAAFRKQHF